MRKSIVLVLVALLLAGGLVVAGCAEKQEGAEVKLTKDQQKALDYMLDYVWTDPSTGKKSAKNIGDSIKAVTGRQPWSGELKLFELGEWEVDKFSEDTYFIKVMVTPNAKAWKKVGKKTNPPSEAVWKVDYKEKRVFATNPQAGYLSWVER